MYRIVGGWFAEGHWSSTEYKGPGVVQPGPKNSSESWARTLSGGVVCPVECGTYPARRHG